MVCTFLLLVFCFVFILYHETSIFLDIDETIIRILLEDDVSKFSMDDKRKLISQIITGSGKL